MSSTLFGRALAIGIVTLAASSVQASDAGFRAQGNEPFWSLRMTDESITFQPMDGDAVTIAPVPTATQDGDEEIFAAAVGGRNFRLAVTGQLCVDTMSGMSFPSAVTVKLGDETYAGCGGEPAALLSGEWRVTAIDGADLVADTEPSLSFDAEGRAVSGNASCNRFFGGFSLTGEGLSFGELGSSMMMCEDAVMAQERALLDILEGTIGFTIADDGSLTLTTGDDRTLSADRGS